MTTGTVRLHRVLRATPEKVYRAFLDPDAMVKWLPPNGGHSFGGTFRELVPHERIRHTDTFDDPSLAGEMQTTISLTKVSVGTEVHVVQEGLPEAIPTEACYLGWQESLTLLRLLVEADVPG